MNYYPHHIGDYLRDTAHLTPLEDGIYRRLLDVYYASEKPLPGEAQWVCKLVRARTTEEIDAVIEILRQYFTKHTDGWRNRRADIEIKAHYRRIKSARDNGKKGGRPRNPVGLQKKPSGLAESGFVHNPSESSQNQIQNQNQKNKDSRAVALPDWLPQGAWKDWLEVRQKSKAPNTPRALTLALEKLQLLRADGNDPKAVLEKATLSGWKSLYPVKSEVPEGVKYDA